MNDKLTPKTTSGRITLRDSQILNLLKAYTGTPKQELTHFAIASLAANYFQDLGGHYPASYTDELEHLALPPIKFPPQDRL